MEVIENDATLASAPCDQVESKALPDHLNDHCYSKSQPDGPVPMDTTPPPATPSEKSQGLTPLIQDQDTFETILLQLLQTFTRHQRQSASRENSPSEPTKPSLNRRSLRIDISAEALNTLSGEQVMALVTSNSVNYEVIQQIRAQKHSNGGRAGDLSVGRSVEPSKTGGSSEDISQQLLQVSPEQLQLLQAQLMEMLNQQKVTIPTDLSPEQQLEMIQTLLVQQLSVPEGASEPSRVSAESAPSPKKPKASSPPKTQSKSQSRPSSKTGSAPSGGRRRREPVKKEPKKPPKPYNIFFGEVYSTVMAANPKMSLPESSKIISDMWEAMGDDVKRRYNEAYEKLEEEYKEALQKYHASKQSAEKATTLQQLLSKSTDSTPPPKTDSKPTTPVTPTTPTPLTPVHPTPTHPTVSQPTSTPSTGLVAAIPLRTEAATTLSNTQVSQDPSRLSVISLEKVLNNPSAPDSSVCVTFGCTNMAVFCEDRGQQYCSSECVVKHCRDVFDSWVTNRKIKV